MRGWVGETPEDLALEKGLRESRQGGQKAVREVTLLLTYPSPQRNWGQKLKEHGGLILPFSLGHPRLLK